MPPRSKRPSSSSTTTLSPPLKILSQILILQLSFYIVAAGLILFTALTAGLPFSPDLVLGWRGVRGDTVSGWTLGLCWLLTSFLEVILLLLLIARSKLIPDFALTLHGLHLVLTWVYSGAVPANALWWGTQACSAALMVGLGMWACQWRELRPITFGGSSSSGSTHKERRTVSGRAGGTRNEREGEGGTKIPGDEERGWWGRGLDLGIISGSGGGGDGGGGDRREDYEMTSLRNK